MACLLGTECFRLAAAPAADMVSVAEAVDLPLLIILWLSSEARECSLVCNDFLHNMTNKGRREVMLGCGLLNRGSFAV